MANFNEGFVFNSDPGKGGFFWNGADYMYVIHVHEVLRYNDDITELVAKYALLDRFELVYNSIFQTALYRMTDNFGTVDDAKVIIVFRVMDNFGVKDEFSNLVVNAYLQDQMNILDEINQIGAYLSAPENINLVDTMTVEALFNLVDQFGFEDLKATLSILFRMNDNMNMTDREPPPKIGETDWLIGTAGEKDRAYDWFLPFDLKVDYGKSSFQIAPEAENIEVNSPGVDGSMVVDTVYKDRLFNIVAYSEQGLSIREKEDLKRKIVNILSTTKEESKKLTIQSRSVSFDVRYQGQMKLTDGPSWVRADIPLRASVYGYDLFENTVVGSGLIRNRGSISSGVRHIIRGECTNPSFSFGGERYSWTGTIKDGWTLTIDHEMKSVWLTDKNGVQTNQLKNFSGKFQKVPAQGSLVLSASGETEKKIRTSWRDNLIW